MSMYPFSYSAVYYNGVDPEIGTSRYRCESGMGFCNDFAEAAAIIAERYGDDLVCIKDLTLYEEDAVILLPAETIHNYAIDMFHDNAQFRCDEFGNPINEKNMFADLVNEDGTFKNPVTAIPIDAHNTNYETSRPTNRDAKIPIED